MFHTMLPQRAAGQGTVARVGLRACRPGTPGASGYHSTSDRSRVCTRSCQSPPAPSSADGAADAPAEADPPVDAPQPAEQRVSLDQLLTKDCDILQRSQSMSYRQMVCPTGRWKGGLRTALATERAARQL